MKKLIVFLIGLALVQVSFAQAPQKMSYQSVIRDASDVLVTDATVGIQISILQGSAAGTAVFVETHAPTTNANGLASLEIGGGTPISGTLASIDWGNGPYFIQSETDPSGGTNYTLTGTTELLSVPYALYAANAGGDSQWNLTGNFLTTDKSVGIGTNFPTTSLMVIGRTRSANAQNSNNYTEILHDNTNGGINTSGDGNLTFRHDNSVLMSLTDQGRLGIGEDAPEGLLHLAAPANAVLPTIFLVGGSEDIAVPGGQALQIGHWINDEFKEALRVSEGIVRIGMGPDATETGVDLHVNGTIKSREVRVTLDGFPDYVFEEDYVLLTLKQIKEHIDVHGHLPNVPSAKEVEENGIGLGELNKILLEKIEELTLLLIEKEGQIEGLVEGQNAIQEQLNQLNK